MRFNLKKSNQNSLFLLLLYFLYWIASRFIMASSGSVIEEQPRTKLTESETCVVENFILAQKKQNSKKSRSSLNDSLLDDVGRVQAERKLTPSEIRIVEMFIRAHDKQNCCKSRGSSKGSLPDVDSNALRKNKYRNQSLASWQKYEQEDEYAFYLAKVIHYLHRTAAGGFVTKKKLSKACPTKRMTKPRRTKPLLNVYNLRQPKKKINYCELLSS